MKTTQHRPDVTPTAGRALAGSRSNLPRWLEREFKGSTYLATWHTTPIVTDVSTVTEIETAIENLTVAEQRALALHLGELLTATESPDALAALDLGIRSLEQNGARSVSRQELEQKVRQWSGASR